MTLALVSVALAAMLVVVTTRRTGETSSGAAAVHRATPTPAGSSPSVATSVSDAERPAAPLRGRVRFSPSGHPASGHVLLEFVSRDPIRLPLDVDGRFVLDETPSIRRAHVALTADVIVSATIERLTPRGADVELSIPDGYLLEGRLATTPYRGPRIAEVIVEAGDIDPEDESVRNALDDPDSIPRESLRRFGTIATARVRDDGSFGPVFAPARDDRRYRGRALADLAVAVSTTRAPDGAPPGSTLDLGELAVEWLAALEVTVVREPEHPPLRLGLSRLDAPSGAGTTADRARADTLAIELFRDRRDFAEVLYGDADVALDDGRPVRFAPIADDAVEVFLKTPANDRSSTLRVDLTPGETTAVTLVATDSFGPEALATVPVDGHVVRRAGESRLPARGVFVQVLGTEIHASTDAEGRFVWPAVPVDRDFEVLIAAFDESLPERTLVQSARFERGESATLMLEIPETTWLEATGLDEWLHPDRRWPLAFALERQTSQGRWLPLSADVFDPFEGGVRVIVDHPSHVVRIRAMWSGLLEQVTEPVALDAEDGAATVRFLAPLPAGSLVGRVVDREGRPAPGVLVHASGPVGGVPPAFTESDGEGRFAFGAINVREVSLLTEAPGLRIAVTDAPASLVVDVEHE